jgi:murein tripeptide amidase MpaA
MIIIFSSRANSVQNTDISFSTDFESGSATNLHVRPDGVVVFSISPDPAGSEYLWFNFKVFGAGDKRLEFVIENALGAHQTGERWNITRPVFSSDGIRWTRAADVSYAREFSLKNPLGAMRYRFWAPFAAETLQVAYSYPYPHAQLESFLNSLRDDPRCAVSQLGLSEDGRGIPQLHLAAPASTAVYREKIWLICREHPGETPASYVCEGFIKALLEHPAGRRLLDQFDFSIVPMLNVDGVTRGYYYRNAKGVNLARDWVSFSSAEVKSLRSALEADAERGRLRLVVNLHSSNDPTKGHFFLKMIESTLKSDDARLQDAFFEAADGNHPQLQGKRRVRLLDIPGITSNGIYRRYGVYTLYLESNYSRGADGSEITPESLREVGLALVQALAEVFVPE